MTIKSFFQSLLAIVVGIVVGAVLSNITDSAFELSGVVPSIADQMANGSPTWFLIVAIVYRTIFTILSCYLGARIAPGHPMRDAIILGAVALLANFAGAISMWSHGQNWYPIILTILALPSAWLGGRLRELQQIEQKRKKKQKQRK